MKPAGQPIVRGSVAKRVAGRIRPRKRCTRSGKNCPTEEALLAFPIVDAASFAPDEGEPARLAIGTRGIFGEHAELVRVGIVGNIGRELGADREVLQLLGAGIDDLVRSFLSAGRASDDVALADRTAIWTLDEIAKLIESDKCKSTGREPPIQRCGEKREPARMSEMSEGAFALLDCLGFKGAWSRGVDPTSIIKFLRDSKQRILQAPTAKALLATNVNTKLEVAFISDSVVVAAWHTGPLPNVASPQGLLINTVATLCSHIAVRFLLGPTAGHHVLTAGNQKDRGRGIRRGST